MIYGKHKSRFKHVNYLATILGVILFLTTACSRLNNSHNATICSNSNNNYDPETVYRRPHSTNTPHSTTTQAPFISDETAWEKLLKKIGSSLESYSYQDKLPPDLSLHYAAWCGNQTILDKLCNDHPDHVNKKTCDNITPLHLAVYQKHDACIRILIDHHATIDSLVKISEIQPIHIASSRGFVSGIKTLLNEGASVEDSDAEGKTPLHWAARNGHTNCVRELLKKGSDPNIQDDLGDTPLCLAFRYGNAAVIKLDLLRKPLWFCF